MRHVSFKQFARPVSTAMLCAALLAGAMPEYGFAQDSDKKTHTIEVKDGKVLVNGEVVSELEGEDYRVMFRKGDEGSVSFFESDDGHGAFKFGDMPDQYRLRSGFDRNFNVKSGNFSRLMLDDGNGHPYVFEVGGKSPFGLFGGDFPSAEVMKMEADARRLAERIRREDGDVTDLEAELDETLERIFDMKMEARAERMEQLESQLQELRERISQRESDRETIIRQRKEELLGRGGRYEW